MSNTGNRYYTTLIEHYLRMATKHTEGNSETSSLWIEITNAWLKTQPEENQEFIKAIFNENITRTRCGITTAIQKMKDQEKKDLLIKLENDFGVYCGLVPGRKEQ